MQSFRSLTPADSDLEASPPVIESMAVAAKPLFVHLMTSVALGPLAGLGFGVSDILRARSAGASWAQLTTSSAVLGLWLWFGHLVGVFVWCGRALASQVQRRVQSRNAWHALLAALAAGAILLFARHVFSSDGLRLSSAVGLAPRILPLAIMLGVWGIASLRADRAARVTRWVLGCAGAALTIGTLVLDARVPGGMLYLHVLLLALGLVLAFQTVELVGFPPSVRYAVLGLSWLTLPSLLTFPSSQLAREVLAQPIWAGQQLVSYVQYHVDFDHDGYSPWFGGADCDDENASVFRGAPERPGDARDSDCDGLDDPKPSTLVFEPFHTQRGGAAPQIAARAKQFPTVVILVDALRFDRIGKSRFPNLAQLSSESIHFTHAYSTSATTLTSVPAMMSGRIRSAPDRETIARSLDRAGQVSEFIAPDVVAEHFEKLGRENPLLDFSVHESIPTHHVVGGGPSDPVPTSPQLTAAAIKRLDSTHPPDLLWLHYFDVHEWNKLDEPGLPLFDDAARYDAVLEHMDASLRPLLDRRDHLNLVLLADHGEGLGARGVRYHSSFVFEELTHIPLLIRVPGIEPASVDVPVTSPGLCNTLRALRGLDPDVTADQSFLVLVGAASIGEGPGFPAFDNAQWSFLYGTHRLLYSPFQQFLELYDVERDPLETKNLADVNPVLASELLSRLFQIRNQSPL